MNREAYANPYTVANSEPAVRAQFIQKTYLHLAGAILAFTGLEAFLVHQQWAINLAGMMLQSWWIVLILFIGVSWIADKWALTGQTLGKQYLGLGLFIVAEAFVFLPLILLAMIKSGQGSNLLGQAAFFTLILFGALTVIAFTTRKDFTFLGGILKIAFFVIMGLIAASFIFPGGINLGTWFSVGMIVVAGASILYSTSNIIRRYRTDQYVAASLSLFSSVALMFWYILSLLMNRD